MTRCLVRGLAMVSLSGSMMRVSIRPGIIRSVEQVLVMREPMQKVNKTKGKVVGHVTGSCLTAKAKNGKAGVAALPFAHRTPNQLHASTYVRKRG